MQTTEQNPICDFSLIEMTEILIKSQRLHEGLYNLSIQFQIAVGAVGPAPDSISPGAIIGIKRIGLSKTEEKNTNFNTVNAAEVNPVPKKRSIKIKP